MCRICQWRPVRRKLQHRRLCNACDCFMRYILRPKAPQPHRTRYVVTCGHDAPYHAQGMCKPCYERHKWAQRKEIPGVVEARRAAARKAKAKRRQAPA